jgi:hypothetical protein
MTPSLSGRLQTRIFALLVLGGIWTGLIGPFLAVSAGLPVSDVYRGTLFVLLLILVLGVLWELLYHGLQQFRWEKDWPTLFGLLTGLNEGLLAFWLATVLGARFGIPVPARLFIAHSVTTRLVAWIFLNGPMRVLFIRWRFNGGRLL